MDVVRAYLALLEAFETREERFLECLHEEFQQTEFPNALNPNGQQSDFASVVQRAASASTLLRSQEFIIENSVESDSQVVVEALWRGVIGADVGAFKDGQTLSANFCFVCQFEGTRIRRQRNYDCFHPF